VGNALQCYLRILPVLMARVAADPEQNPTVPIIPQYPQTNSVQPHSPNLQSKTNTVQPRPLPYNQGQNSVQPLPILHKPTTLTYHSLKVAY